METRKSVSSLILLVLCLSALWINPVRALTLYKSNAHDFQGVLTQSQRERIDEYARAVLENALSNEQVDFIQAPKKTQGSPHIYSSLMRTADSERDFYWISPLVAFECSGTAPCTPNAGSQSKKLAVVYIAIDKNTASFEFADRLTGQITEYKRSEGFYLLANHLKSELSKSFSDIVLTYGILSLAGQLRTDASDLWVIADVVPLFSEKDERGKVKGIAADLVNSVLKEVSLPQYILSAPWERIAKEAMSKSNVLVFAVIRTAERDDVFHWVTPVSRNLHGLYGINKPYFETFEDVPRTFKVGTLLEDYRYNVALEHGFNVKAYDSWKELVEALFYNEIDTIFGSQGAIDFGCNPNQFKCETITLSSKYDISTAYLALSKKDTCIFVLEKLKLAAADVKMSDEFNERLSSWSDMVSQEYGIAHHTEHGVVHLWNPN
ncbi:ABC transporter substrate-binding protein [Alteromonas sp. IB21]|uniref:substrate-binding periplasmic protein n=1 Tax=Alteromonas sp. IB21 TaxID=2779369 RepID=UPI0018E7B239|nr:ABC transporter substrate-binding protein [Alteromonas sp. IB21]